MGQNNAVEVEHNGETIEVPSTFERTELATYFGGVPESFEVDRAFIFEDNVRVESYQGDGEWVEATYQTEESAPIFNASELGWVAEIVDAPEDGEEPGETVWER